MPSCPSKGAFPFFRTAFVACPDGLRGVPERLVSRFQEPAVASLCVFRHTMAGRDRPFRQEGHETPLLFHEFPLSIFFTFHIVFLCEFAWLRRPAGVFVPLLRSAEMAVADDSR